MWYSQSAKPVRAAALARAHLGVAGRVAARLKRRYGWVRMDELYSYALFGLVVAAAAYDAQRGLTFEQFALQKAAFGAIDEMRREGVLRRRSQRPGPRLMPLVEADSSGEPSRLALADERADQDRARLEARDLCSSLLARLPEADRKLILMYYADGLTFREIAEVLGMCEAWVCLRHRHILTRLRAMSRCRGDR